MALTPDKIITVSTTSGTATTAAFSTLPNVVLFAFTSSGGGGAGGTSTVSGAGLTWVLVKRTNTNAGDAEIWRSQSTSALSGVTVAASNTFGNGNSLTVVSFTGADMSGTNGSAAVGATGTGTGSTGTETASLTTTRDNSWVWAAGFALSVTARTVGTNQTMVFESAGTGDDRWCQRQTNRTDVTGTSVTINETAPTTDNWDLSLVEILPPVSVGQTGTNHLIVGDGMSRSEVAN